MIYEYLARGAMLSADVPPDIKLMAEESLHGDGYAEAAFWDWTLENEKVSDYPFKVGDKVFFFQLTLYYLGEVTEIGRGWVRMKDCHWVHWTGRVGSLFATMNLDETHGRRRPRTEYLGDFIVLLGAGVGCKIWTGDIPKVSIQ